MFNLKFLIIIIVRKYAGKIRVKLFSLNELRVANVHFNRSILTFSK